jgi:outer membrane lipoprotein-sorting protein
MYKFISILFLLFFAVTINAQKDPKAKEILDDVSATTKSFSTIRVKFLNILENRQENLVDTISGYAFLKGSKYKLILPGHEIFSDGATVWTYMKDAEEINITEPDEESVMNPANIFTIYEKGFKYRFIQETSFKGKNIYEIDLYPEKPKKEKYTRITIKIDKSKKQILSIKSFGRDGINNEIEVVEFKPDVTINDKIFIYEESRYKGVEVIDMRF